MVHLTTVPSDASAVEQAVQGLDKAKFFPSDGGDDVNASVYGSRFAAQDLPTHEMPEGEMPREIAYRMIK